VVIALALKLSNTTHLLKTLIVGLMTLFLPNYLHTQLTSENVS
jgi:hypothetical protein